MHAMWERSREDRDRDRGGVSMRGREREREGRRRGCGWAAQRQRLGRCHRWCCAVPCEHREGKGRRSGRTFAHPSFAHAPSRGHRGTFVMSTCMCSAAIGTSHTPQGARSSWHASTRMARANNLRLQEDRRQSSFEHSCMPSEQDAGLELREREQSPHPVLHDGSDEEATSACRASTPAQPTVNSQFRYAP